MSATQVAQKVSAEHLARTAYLYVRQSTLRQVRTNTESAERQYALRQRAVQLGWPSEQIMVIDSDQGQSGASSADREGFQRLVADVGLGKAGVVLGLEVSRLARNNADWHRLLEICALSRTLICDEDGLYDPADFNDRLLLGLKGTMSEAELHFIRARLQGGILSKARRGELPMPLPVGLVDDSSGKVALDPDAGVQHAIGHLFDCFVRTSSARAVVQAFNRDGLLFPTRIRTGERKGDLVWSPLTHSRVLRTLHNPRYAGAFAYGQRRTRKTASGKTTTRVVPREEWMLIPDAHPGYITLEQYERNLRTLAANATAHGTDRAAGPAREGTALLQGLAVCGRCGQRMTVRYHTRKGVQVPDYQCIRVNIQTAGDKCQVIQGNSVDAAISRLLLDTVTPLALEVALNVQAELEARADEADQLRKTHVQRARQHAELARRRYLAVDPGNRLVADTLEADWNDTLRAVQTAQDEYERQTAAANAALTEQHKQRIRQLASDFPTLWNDPATPARERKRVVRLLIEDVTLTKADQNPRARPLPRRADHHTHAPQGTELLASQAHPARHPSRDRPAARPPHRRPGRSRTQPARPALRNETAVHPPHRRRHPARQQPAQPPQASARPRTPHPPRDRRAARRAPQHHPRLAPRRTAPRPQNDRQARLPLRTTPT